MGAGPSHCYNVANTNYIAHNAIIDSGASMTFTTTTSTLSNPKKHKTTINIANGQKCFTEAMGKYKVTNTKIPIYITAMSAPRFAHDLVSVGQLATKHDVIFTKDSCYLQGPTTAPFDAQHIG